MIIIIVVVAFHLSVLWTLLRWQQSTPYLQGILSLADECVSMTTIECSKNATNRLNNDEQWKKSTSSTRLDRNLPNHTDLLDHCWHIYCIAALHIEHFRSTSESSCKLVLTLWVMFLLIWFVWTVCQHSIIAADSSLGPCSIDQFTCNPSSTCIALSLKCDGKQDCVDKSDEIHCRELVVLIYFSNWMCVCSISQKGSIQGRVHMQEWSENTASMEVWWRQGLWWQLGRDRLQWVWIPIIVLYSRIPFIQIQRVRVTSSPVQTLTNASTSGKYATTLSIVWTNPMRVCLPAVRMPLVEMLKLKFVHLPQCSCQSAQVKSSSAPIVGVFRTRKCAMATMIVVTTRTRPDAAKPRTHVNMTSFCAPIHLNAFPMSKYVTKTPTVHMARTNKTVKRTLKSTVQTICSTTKMPTNV